ncbi:hypothetical protein [Chitinivorax sp. B]|uniref:hypothetical protein n=1 Tax=Chitinivorax sp. B TaxID=2502235 RepID=UPI0010F636E0|nr:hypothetical protein [Chitinivorax sp. B]
MKTTTALGSRLLTLAGIGLLAACGSENNGQQTTPSRTAPVDHPSSVATNTFTGMAIDGYLSGALVCLDLNRNDRCDANEPQGKTDAQGKYAFNLSPGLSPTEQAQARLLAEVAVGVQDSDRPGAPIKVGQAYRLRAPVTQTNAILSPFTTLLVSRLGEGPVTAESMVTEAGRLRQALGLADNAPLLTDYVAQSGQSVVATQLHSMGKVLTRLLARLGGDVGAASLADGQLMTLRQDAWVNGTVVMANSQADELAGKLAQAISDGLAPSVVPSQPVPPTTRPVPPPTSPFDSKWSKLDASGRVLGKQSLVTDGWRCIRDNRDIIADQANGGQGDIWLLLTPETGAAPHGTPLRNEEVTENEIDSLVAHANRQRLCGVDGWQVPSVAQLQNLNTYTFKLDGRYWATLDAALFPEHRDLARPGYLKQGAYWSNDFDVNGFLNNQFIRKLYVYAGYDADTAHVDQAFVNDGQHTYKRLRLVYAAQPVMSMLDREFARRTAAYQAIADSFQATLTNYQDLLRQARGWGARDVPPTREEQATAGSQLNNLDAALQNQPYHAKTALTSMQNLAWLPDDAKQVRSGFNRPGKVIADMQAAEARLLQLQNDVLQHGSWQTAIRQAVARAAVARSVYDQWLAVQGEPAVLDKLTGDMGGSITLLLQEPTSPLRLQAAHRAINTVSEKQIALEAAMGALLLQLPTLAPDTERERLLLKVKASLDQIRTNLSFNNGKYQQARQQFDHVLIASGVYSKLARDGSPLPATATLADGWHCVRDNLRKQVWLVGEVELRNHRQVWIKGNNELLPSTGEDPEQSNVLDTALQLQKLAAGSQLCGQRQWRYPSLTELASLDLNHAYFAWMQTGGFVWTKDKYSMFQIASRAPLFRGPDSPGAQEERDYRLGRSSSRAKAWLTADESTVPIGTQLRWLDAAGNITNDPSQARCAQDLRSTGKLWLLQETPVTERAAGDIRKWRKGMFDSDQEYVAGYRDRFNQAAVCGVTGGWRLPNLTELKGVESLSLADRATLGFVLGRGPIRYHWACRDVACGAGQLYDPMTQSTDYDDGFKRATVHLIHD